MSERRIRLAVIVSHPIQYHAPLFRAIASSHRINLKVFYCSRAGVQEYWDRGFSRRLKWDVPLTEGYDYEFLPNWSPVRDTTRSYGLLNPSVMMKVRRDEFDAVLVFGWGHLTEWMAFLTAAIQGVPVLLRSDTNADARLPNGLAYVRRLALALLFNRVSGFLVVGRQNAQLYSSFGVPAQRMFSAPFAVDNDFFLSGAESYRGRKESLRKELGLDQTATLFLFVGKLVPAKRPRDLLLAYERIMERRNSALVFVGDGELRPMLERYVSHKGLSRVSFAGFQGQKALCRYYATADALVLPSGREAWGLVVNEAMCFGLPIIATKESGASGDLILDGVNGFTYSAGDVATLADHMALLSDDSNLRRQMGDHSLSFIKKWGLQETTRGLEACLETISCENVGRILDVD